MGKLTIPATGSVYLDANCIIYFVERIDPYYQLIAPVWEAASNGAIRMVTSELTILEVLVRPLRERMELVEQAFRGVLFQSRELALIPVSREILEKAAQIRATHSLKTADSIHAASAFDANATLVLTNDGGFRKVDGLHSVILSTMI